MIRHRDFPRIFFHEHRRVEPRPRRRPHLDAQPLLQAQARAGVASVEKSRTRFVFLLQSAAQGDGVRGRDILGFPKPRTGMQQRDAIGVSGQHRIDAAPRARRITQRDGIPRDRADASRLRACQERQGGDIHQAGGCEGHGVSPPFLEAFEEGGLFPFRLLVEQLFKKRITREILLRGNGFSGLLCAKARGQHQAARAKQRGAAGRNTKHVTFSLNVCNGG